MKKAVLTLPNLLTLLRIVLIPFFVMEIVEGRFPRALALFFIAGFTDFLDGLIARRFNQQSELGQKLDPIADKLLAMTTFLVLALPNPHYQSMPVWLTVTVVLRDVTIVTTALLIRNRTGFNDFKPSQPGKWHTTLLSFTVLAFLATNTFGRYTEYLIVFYLATLAMTIFSGVHYIFFINRALRAYRRGQE